MVPLPWENEAAATIHATRYAVRLHHQQHRGSSPAAAGAGQRARHAPTLINPPVPSPWLMRSDARLHFRRGAYLS